MPAAGLQRSRSLSQEFHLFVSRYLDRRSIRLRIHLTGIEPGRRGPKVRVPRIQGFTEPA